MWTLKTTTDHGRQGPEQGSLCYGSKHVAEMGVDLKTLASLILDE